MPQIDWNLDSSVGDRKITSSHIALLIGNRFKAAIRDNLVLPNCESISIPWMIAEQDDWVPRNVAPFIWSSHESMDMTGPELSVSQAREDKLKLDGSNKTKDSCDNKVEKLKNVVHVEQPSQESLAGSHTSGNGLSRSVSDKISYSSIYNELRMPLLTGESEKNSSQSNMETPKVPSPTPAVMVDEEDQKPKRTSSRRARLMMDFGKRVGGKLEEKKRHIEEKGRHIVEKMCESSRT